MTCTVEFNITTTYTMVFQNKCRHNITLIYSKIPLVGDTNPEIPKIVTFQTPNLCHFGP